MSQPAIVIRPILTNLFTPERIHAHLTPPGTWHPFPTASERDTLNGLPNEERKRMVAEAEEFLGIAWPELPATMYADFQRNGNRSRYEGRYFARRSALSHLVLGECAEGVGRFLDDIINGVWAICEETSWCVPAHVSGPNNPLRALPDPLSPYVDLFAAETGALLTWTHYLLGNQLAAVMDEVPKRIIREVHTRILAPYRTRDDWWWLGKARTRQVNNWNPWIHSNILAANLLLEPDATVHTQTVERIIEGLDVFLAAYDDDGGCDEGTSYWGHAAASLFDNLDTLHSASNGALDGFGVPLVQEMGRYIYRMHIGGAWYVNFADGAAQTTPEADLVYRYGKRIADPHLMAQGAYASHVAAGIFPRSGIARQLAAIFNAAELVAADATPPLIREAWLPGIQVLAAREQEGSANGLFLAVKGGHNDESHNHNDVGSFIVALDGVPVVIDVGVETYSRATFSSERYTIWTMQSAYHNLPLINGFGQMPGEEFAARDVSCAITDTSAELRLDIAGAYPPEAHIASWRRTARLERGPDARIVIEDAFALTETPATLAMHLMVAGDVDTTATGILRCTHGARLLHIRYDAATFTPVVEAVSTEDPRLHAVWGDRIFRVRLEAIAPTANGNWTLTFKTA